ncbi:MAG: nicotinate-nucleotide--dimethylbenzimidazole phosphoribosyltransferase [Betaproteobacteria bacterium]|nr:nicotinate-nucleotide--dimethylbenzimidazole phosphoribosyltransferase [Betaproteobacteria bacterium]
MEPLGELHLEAGLRRDLDAKTKPRGSLGRLEALAIRLGLILGSQRPQLLAPQLLIFAADHGLSAQGVSAYPTAVTRQMVRNFLAGGAAASVLARQHGLALGVVDCGVAASFEPQEGLYHAKVEGCGFGTADASQGPAMRLEQAVQAIHNGAQLVSGRPGNVLILGEMGIANTSAASLLMARLTGFPIAQCVGRGTGLDDAGLARKIAVLSAALAVNARALLPLEVLAALGGLEIATMVGAVLQAAAQRRIVLVDGFVTTAAVALACALAPGVLERCVFAHVSAESGHAAWLRQLGAEPLLDLGLRLGEGSGAALAWPLLVSACRLLAEMAVFSPDGVVGQPAPTD